MIRRITRPIGLTILVVLTLAATTALAQGTRITGTVSRIEPATRTIYFADGSVVQVQRGAVVTVNDREVAFEALTPGANATVASAAPTVGVPATPTAQTPADVTGTVAQVDRQNGVITLQDGRAIKLSGQSIVWQAAPIDAIQPGAQIYVPNAQRLAMAPRQPVAVAPPPQQPIDPSLRVGTVKSLDRNNSMIRLSDGTFVKVLPATRLQSGGRTIAFSDLRAGDKVAVRPYGRSTVEETMTISRGDDTPASAIKADYIEVTRIPS